MGICSSRLGSLESETLKHGLDSLGIRTRECLCWRGPVGTVNGKPFFLSEKASHIDKTTKSERNKNLTLNPRKGMTSRMTGRLTVVIM
jgi:hypothetical protein